MKDIYDKVKAAVAQEWIGIDRDEVGEITNAVLLALTDEVVCATRYDYIRRCYFKDLDDSYRGDNLDFRVDQWIKDEAFGTINKRSEDAH